MTITGNPTELCKKLRQRTDKPHIFIKEFSFGVYSLSYNFPVVGYENDCSLFIKKVNPHWYGTAGRAARDWYYAKYRGRF